MSQCAAPTAPEDYRSTIRGFVNPRVRQSSPNLNPNPKPKPRPIYSTYMTVGLTNPGLSIQYSPEVMLGVSYCPSSTTYATSMSSAML